MQPFTGLLSVLRPRFQPPDFEGEDGQLPRAELGVGTAYAAYCLTEAKESGGDTTYNIPTT